MSTFRPLGTLLSPGPPAPLSPTGSINFAGTADAVVASITQPHPTSPQFSLTNGPPSCSRRRIKSLLRRILQ